MEISFFSSTIVQVAISIVISWALFALTCSMVHEIFVQMKSERGRFFRRKIHQKLFDSSNQINWGLLLYSHSSIKLLTRSEKQPPTEINSNTFAEVIIDVVSNSHAAKVQAKNGVIPSIYQSELLNKLDYAVNNLQQSDLITVIRNALTTAKIKATTGGAVNENQLYLNVVADLQNWFDQFGERTSAWYKKLTRKRLFVIGLILSTFANVDSVALYDYYSKNPAARAGITEYYTKNNARLEELSHEIEIAGANMNPSSVEALEEKIKAEKEHLDVQIDSLKTNLKLPIGWENNKCKASVTPEIWQIVHCIIYKILGLVLSALAACLGAPFWFDVLKKATRVNETIIKPKL